MIGLTKHWDTKPHIRCTSRQNEPEEGEEKEIEVRCDLRRA